MSFKSSKSVALRAFFLAFLAMFYSFGSGERLAKAPTGNPQEESGYLYKIPGDDGDKYGYMDSAGNLVIQPQFDDGQSAFRDLGWVWLNGKPGYINRGGSVAISLKEGFWDNFTFGLANGSGEFHEGRALLDVGDKVICIDDKGEHVFTLQAGNLEAPSMRGLPSSRNISRTRGLVLTRTGRWSSGRDRGMSSAPEMPLFSQKRRQASMRDLSSSQRSKDGIFSMATWIGKGRSRSNADSKWQGTSGKAWPRSSWMDSMDSLTGRGGWLSSRRIVAQEISTEGWLWSDKQ